MDGGEGWNVRERGSEGGKEGKCVSLREYVERVALSESELKDSELRERERVERVALRAWVVRERAAWTLAHHVR